MKKAIPILFLACMSLAGCAQKSPANNRSTSEKSVGGPCEGCEAIYESPVPFDQLDHIDTIENFNEPGPKLEISGTIFHRDGKTPAKDVVMYFYHTDQKGLYPKKGNEKGWAERHGYLRGWIKTDKNGSYKFYTLLPASYPEGRNPKHIHATIKEEGLGEYWIDEFLFEGDPFLEQSSRPPRGGNGVVTPVIQGGLLRATRNITLGLNVPGYPEGIMRK